MRVLYHTVLRTGQATGGRGGGGVGDAATQVALQGPPMQSAAKAIQDVEIVDRISACTRPMKAE